MYLWYVSNTITFRQLANLFDVAQSTSCVIVQRVSDWLVSISDECVKWPEGVAAEATKN